MLIIFTIIVSVVIVGGIASTKLLEPDNTTIVLPSSSTIQQGQNMLNYTCQLEPLSNKMQPTPQQMEGPYFIDVVPERSNIQMDPDSGKLEDGIPLLLQIHVFDMNDNCEPLVGARVDIWHANAYGVYSGIEEQNTVGKKFLRGYQLTDKNGLVEFTTVYPGWYEGRTIHIHIKIRTFENDYDTEWTSQLYMDDFINDKIHQQAPYLFHGMLPVNNNQDGIYIGPSTDGLLQSNSGKYLMLNVIEDEMYVGTFNVVLNTDKSK